MNPSAKSKGCATTECRVKMLREMYEAVKGTVLLLESLQPNPDDFPTSPSSKRLEGAFKTLIATILSVRSKDETTIRVVDELWDVYPTPKAMAAAPLDKLEELIKSSGTYRQKAKRIKETAKIIHEKYDDKVPENRELLLKLPGVGRKVANCVLVTSFCKPAIPVDTHVHRISNRIGWVDTIKPEDTELALEKLFPENIWTLINYTMVSFGKTICKPINPLCASCPVQNRCLKLIKETKAKHNPKSKNPKK